MEELAVSERLAIQVQDASVIFPNGGNGITAIQDISLNIYRNEFVSLLGPSGCGKSTLIRLMSDLIQPTLGTIAIEQNNPSEARLLRKFGIVFQSPILMEWRTVRDNIELPLEISGILKKARRAISDEMLELVGLTKFHKHYPWQLSGGMQQRVAIARALALNPSILFMDEPFSSLDEFTKERLQTELLRIREKTKKTIVFVTHSISEAVYLSDRIVVLSAHPGRIHSIIDVKLDPSRPSIIRESEAFYDYMKQVRNCFHHEVGGSNDDE
ncbi:MAG: sulfonate ABC transporter ATP-binding protein [Paenibacillus sp. RIFOXYA1_FULL_44_5]|nr:MAG: sulfonate ABC transporter ATP-binding protein [Paenibacillus sp. RIFOXYA1_FULL_44_5]